MAVVAVPEVAAEVVVVLASVAVAVAVAEVGVVPASAAAAAVEQPVCLRPVFRPLAVV